MIVAKKYMYQKNKLLRFLVLLLPLLFGSNVSAQKKELPSVNAYITTQQSEDGVIDKDRLFIFYFSYIPKELYGFESCSIQSITINNLTCSSNSLGGIRGTWFKPEYSSKEESGEKFKCSLRKIDANRWEFIVEDPIDVSGKLSHRLILKDNKLRLSELIDYSGNLSKYSTITKKTETVNYKPIISNGYENWSAYDVKCNKIAIPVIVK